MLAVVVLVVSGKLDAHNIARNQTFGQPKGDFDNVSLLQVLGCGAGVQVTYVVCFLDIQDHFHTFLLAQDVINVKVRHSSDGTTRARKQKGRE